MKLLVILVIVFNFIQGGFAQEVAAEETAADVNAAQCTGPCDPCVCKGIPGLVYNAELDQCAWPDEVGCKLNELGYDANCDGEEEGALKAADFEIPNLPEDVDKARYFVVCVAESTLEDIETRKTQRARAYILPSGPVVPRLLGCPEGSAFNAESKICESDSLE